MKLIIIFILYLSLAESIFVDRECVGNEDVLDCSMMDGNNFYAASRSTEFGRVKFTRLTGQLDLTNLPQVRLVEVRYGEPECSQLYSYHGLVVLNGEHSSVFCQIDELTTESTPTTNPTTNAQTLETGEEQSSPSEKMTLSTAESSFSTSMGENTDGFENKDFTSTVRFIVTAIISCFITWIIQDISDIILDKLIEFHNNVIQYIERIERQNGFRRRYPRRIRRRPDFLQYNN